MDWQCFGPPSKRIPCSSCLLHWIQNIPWQTGGLGTAQQTRQSHQVKAVVTESLLASRNSQTGGKDGSSSRMTLWGWRSDSILGMPCLGLQGRARLWFKGQTPQVSWEVSLNLTRQPHICVTFPPALIAPARLLFHGAQSHCRLQRFPRNDRPGQNTLQLPTLPWLHPCPSGAQGCPYPGLRAAEPLEHRCCHISQGTKLGEWSS